ncbi:RNA polymerase sigma factor [Daejeonella sp.]|uniref:RNA polymerase sigma factor n=1 Tax=Daejeonella sp. TaxID=2805397 RepID=UPI002730754F|nr:RNA polymerase sigma-70 factor [Daejeonella sp.]MDP2414713.1 RNA polymerase sigma-70 factor [Daejeonella sp.]
MSIYNSLKDSELLGLLRSGNEKAFAEIYERYWGLMFHHVLKMTGDKDETKDLVQELFTNLWLNVEQIEPETNIAAYLYVSARNKVINLIRHDKVKNNYLSSLSNFANHHQNSILEQLSAKDLSIAIEREIQNLPSKMREIFELSRKKIRTHKEIAEELQISDKTVKKQINNAIKILRLRLNIFILILTIYLSLVSSISQL